jgi:TonB-dependent Receptor Plug Domain.
MIRGARSGNMAYFIDGVKVNGVGKIPGAAIGGLTVYTSAIPAKYGDTSGGVIIMETKSYADLYRRWKIMTTKPK